jgi:hypothetical protein
VEWIGLAQDNDSGTVNTVMNLDVPCNVGNLTSFGNFSISNTTVRYDYVGSITIFS